MLGRIRGSGRSRCQVGTAYVRYRTDSAGAFVHTPCVGGYFAPISPRREGIKFTRLVPARIGTKVRFRGALSAVVGCSAPRRLQHALAQTRELEKALAMSRQEVLAARQELSSLSETNARLRELADQREHEIAKARYFAYHDELTGLPNRALLLDRLNQVLAGAKRHDRPFALLFVDLDRFKEVNDRLGHFAGDTLLQRVAERLLSCVRGGDTACRYGGDEFVLLLPEVDSENGALDAAEKIRVRLASPYDVEGHSIALTATVGVAVYPDDGQAQADLIKHADRAMYQAKTRKGKSKSHLTMAASR